MEPFASPSEHSVSALLVQRDHGIGDCRHRSQLKTDVDFWPIFVVHAAPSSTQPL
jgi:hypothetical protein